MDATEHFVEREKHQEPVDCCSQETFLQSHIPQNNKVRKWPPSIASLCWKYGVFSQYTYGRKTQRAVQDHIPCRTASSIAVRSFAISFQRFSSNRIVQQLSDLLPGRWWNPYTDESLAGNKKNTHAIKLQQSSCTLQYNVAVMWENTVGNLWQTSFWPLLGSLHGTAKFELDGDRINLLLELLRWNDTLEDYDKIKHLNTIKVNFFCDFLRFLKQIGKLWDLARLKVTR